ncbi:hypothetical protein AMTR_s00019p00212170 [Amborella trichopoda]|uniref:Uncharacterized protein n=1 Tax=Amborella trichopoda TaxID=13333 RepID=W1PHV4_AMBTC|nr:hypothetical protein AMTR_s00019p00212170 [Amborella trichopoda]
MWLQKLYCWSACLHCRIDLFNRRSVVAPKSVLPERVLALLERVSSLPERPIQLQEHFGSRRYTVGASPCIFGALVLIAGEFKWIVGVHEERVVGKSHDERERVV